MLTFSTSLALGEELCCGHEEEVTYAAGDSFPGSLTKIAEKLGDQPHFCSGHSDSSHTQQDHRHSCAGCSHTPFTQVIRWIISADQVLEKLFLIEQNLIFTNPFLDGPFHPPRATT